MWTVENASVDADICIRFRWIKNGGIRKRISVDESEIDLNQFEHFLKANLDQTFRSEIDLNQCEHFLKTN